MLTTTLRQTAEDAAAVWVASTVSLEGVCLFGSVARGDDDETSDIDLLVVGTEPLTPGHFRRMLPESVQERVSVSYYVPATLDVYLERWSRFAVHLRTEGQILADRHGLLRAALETVRPVDTEFELREQLAHLENLDHLNWYGGGFLFPLSDLYRFGRTVVFALLAERGVFQFNHERAFAELSRQLPGADDDVRTVAALRPFFLVTKGRLEREDVPFSDLGCTDEVAEAIGAVRRLVRLSQHAAKLTD
ncbi:MAG: nucleotidyltransferase domain-containing protein [Acidimicrobiales bacterium]